MSNIASDRPFLAYLASMDDESIQRLYESNACVVAIYRMLPPIAQQCIVKLLPKPSNWTKWNAKRNQVGLSQAIQLLQKLRIATGDEEGNVRLNDCFREFYISSLLTSPLDLSGIERVEELDKKARKAASKDLYKQAVDRWECILRYLALPSDMIKKGDKGEGVSADTRHLFQHVGFTRGDDRDLEITSLGFHFLLLNRIEQIWTYVIYYLKYRKAIGEDVVRDVELMLQLTLCCVPLEQSDTNGKDDGDKPSIVPFRISSQWTEGMTRFLTHLRELGLIFIRKRKDGYFFLTPLLTLLATAGSAKELGAEHAKNKGFLVVETNYRVYAYTNSSLQLAILSTFTEMIYRFSDVVVGVMSRDSVRRALQAGITARQIVLYLRSNAHPEMVASHGIDHCLPSTVVDQIHLWEDERKRLVYNEAVIYSTFESEAEYVGLRDYASEQKFLLWHDNAQKVLVVTDEGHNIVKEWWKTQRQA